jgi:hypothetical protein
MYKFLKQNVSIMQFLLHNPFKIVLVRLHCNNIHNIHNIHNIQVLFQESDGRFAWPRDPRRPHLLPIPGSFKFNFNLAHVFRQKQKKIEKKIAIHSAKPEANGAAFGIQGGRRRPPALRVTTPEAAVRLLQGWPPPGHRRAGNGRH